VPNNKKIISQGSSINTGNEHFIVFNVNGDNVVIDGLIIKGASKEFNGNGRLINIKGVDNGVNNPPSFLNNIKVVNCTLYNAGQSGVKAEYVDNLYVYNNIIYDVGYSGVEISSCKNSKVDNNKIYNITGLTLSNGSLNAYGI